MALTASGSRRKVNGVEPAESPDGSGRTRGWPFGNLKIISGSLFLKSFFLTVTIACKDVTLYLIH